MAGLASSFNLTTAFVGGIESYFEIIAGLTLGGLLYNYGVSEVDFRRFVVLIVSPIISFSIILYLVFPDITFLSINKYSFGVENTGQWRFSGFFGLPYYAAVAYLYIMFESFVFLKENKSSWKTAFVIINSLVLFLGGMLTVSKTFFVGLPFLFFAFDRLFNSRRDKLVKYVSIFLLLTSGVFVLLNFSVPDEYKGSVKLLNQYYDRGVIRLVSDRYSDDNTVTNKLLDDENWNELGGVGVNAQTVPTDSQYLDLIYRFGYIALFIFFFFLILFFIWLDFYYKMLFIGLFLAALGSNAFTPINTAIMMWCSFSLNIITRKKGEKR
ncbi:MAG: hypothetical protein V7749_14255 [Cocleimonas sp.]